MPNDRITLLDRALAACGFFTSLGMTYAGKFSNLALIMLCIAVIPRVAGQPNALRVVTKIPTLAVVAGLFSALAMVSASWSPYPQVSFSAGCTFAMVVILGHFLHRGLELTSRVSSILFSGWFLIGFVFGNILLLIELHTAASMQLAVMNFWPALWESGIPSLWVTKSDKLIYISPAAFNWSAAGANLLVWPSLAFIALSQSSAGFKRWSAIAVFMLVVGSSFSSEHQSSQVAILASALVFGLSLNWPRLVRHAAPMAVLTIVLGVIPLSTFAFHKLELHKSSWIQESMQQRIAFWGNTADKIPNAVLIGIGARASSSRIVDQQTEHPEGQNTQFLHPHNMVLQTWLELGAVGALLFLSAGMIIVYECNKLHPKVLPFGYAAATSGFLLSIATWSIWNTWFISGCALQVALIALANRWANEPTTASEPNFKDIWLPKFR